MTYRGKYSSEAYPSMYKIKEALEFYAKPESMKYPHARYPSSFPSTKYPSPFPSSRPSLMSAAYPYSLPISALPYPSPFPTHYMDSHPIPSDMDHLGNKLYSAPYLFALGSGHHLKVREELKSVVSTVDLGRSINLPYPADPCFSQKLTAFNAGKIVFFHYRTAIRKSSPYYILIQQHAIALAIYLAIARLFFKEFLGVLRLCTSCGD